MSVIMCSKKSKTLIPGLLLIFVSLASHSQSISRYSEGTVIFASNKQQKAYLWLNTTIEGNTVLNIKESETSLPRPYTPSDVLSFTIDKPGTKYVSDSLLLGPDSKQRFLRVILEGDYSLFSYESYYDTIFYLRDKEENIYELKDGGPGNSTFPGEQLKELFGSDADLIKDIESVTYTSKSLLGKIKTYHRRKGLSFEQYPPPVISSVFLELTSSAGLLKHVSEIDPIFVSRSPVFSGSLSAGMRLHRDIFELAIEAAFLKGSIYHEDKIELEGVQTNFYEETIKPTLLSGGIGITAYPIRSETIKPFISLGLNYHHFLKYNRQISEERLYHSDQSVIYDFSEFSDPPDDMSGVLFKAGATIKLNNVNFLKVYYSYHLFFGEDKNFINNNGISLTYQISIFKL